MLKPYIGEFIGTFALSGIVLIAIAAPQLVSLGAPILAALILGLLVYVIGHVSGAHFNPAITIGILSLKKIGWQTALFYIISQFAGAALAILVAKGFNIGQIGGDIPNNLRIALAEAAGGAVFGFGVASVVYGRVSSSLNGVVVGGSLLMGLTFAAVLGAGGLVNPAVAFTIGAFNLAFALGPIVGVVIGMQAYKYLSEVDYYRVKMQEVDVVIEVEQ